MILQTLLLIVGTYLSIAFTLFFKAMQTVNKENDKITMENDDMKLDMRERDIKITKILYLCNKINNNNK